MPLTTGARLGAYEIVAPLGAGGMGEVYRARDTRLDRTVALKILPDRFAERADLRERFEREARVVSNLNHPNICTLYDVGRDGETAFFVMEYLDGQPLSDRLSKGPLPLDQTVKVAIDIADALAKAHRHGIVHRDLKPGNIMLTRSGAKLLDFGLARRFDSQPLLIPDAPTVQAGSPLTSEGMILGTLQYMSPEQLEGGEIDARSDIFSFGAVLYEMITGQRAFVATSHASLITRIMSGDPRPVREIAPVTPPSLERIVHRCLAKDPDARWQCAGDLVTELRSVSESAPEATTSVNKRRTIVPWLGVAAMTLVAAILGVMLVRRVPATNAPVRFSIPQPAEGALFPSTDLSSSIAVSPDGNTIAFLATRSGERNLWLRRLGESESKMLDHTRDALAPFWSPDGKSIGFFSAGALSAVDIDSATAHKICDTTPGAAASGTWGRDGTIVFSQLAANDGLYVVSAAGGTAKRLPATPGQPTPHYPKLLSDGRRVLFSTLEPMSTSLWASSIDDWKPQRVADKMSHVDYVAPYVVFARAGALVGQRFDEEKLQLTGQPVVLAPSVYIYAPTAHSAHGVAGRTLAWFPFPPQMRMVSFDRKGTEIASVAPPGDYELVRISPDGKRVIATVVDRTSGIPGLWLVDTARKALSRVTFTPTPYDHVQWSPDGKRIVYTMEVEGPAQLFVRTLGDYKDEMLVPPGGIQIPSHWAGDRIIYSDNSGATRGDILMVSVRDRSITPWQRTPSNEWHARLSPDGRWMAFLSDETGRAELYVAPFDRSAPAIRISSAGVNSHVALWRADNRELYFLSGRNVFAVGFDPATGSTIGEPVRLFSVPTDIRSFDVSPDGQRFLLNIEQESREQFISVLVGWQRVVEAQSASR